MISLKSFINAIQEAIVNANDILQDRNVGLINKYFFEVGQEGTKTDNNKTSNPVLEPKRVILEYHTLDASGNLETSEIHVPLITLVPLQMPQVEKAVLTSEFEIEEVKGEIELNFSRRSSKGLFNKSTPNRCKLEITLTTVETTNGIKVIVEGYESILKRQIM